MYIVFVATEAVPFAKIGGVADVIGCLPKELAELGHRVQVILPLHSEIDRSLLTRQANPLEVEFHGKKESFFLWRAFLPDSEVPVHFIERSDYFEREDPYGMYPDNARRYAFFSLAVLETILWFRIPCQVLHIHDWPTALITRLFQIPLQRTSTFPKYEYSFNGT
jgi:starch synthase